MNIAELKELIAELPDNMPVEVGLYHRVGTPENIGDVRDYSVDSGWNLRTATQPIVEGMNTGVFQLCCYHEDQIV